MNKNNLSEAEAKSMLEEILAEPLEVFTAEELQISPALAARSRAAALQAYYLAKMRDAYHPSFTPLSLREFLTQLGRDAGVVWHEVLNWWGVDRWLSSASASLALTELAKAIGVSAEKVELHLRIGLAQEISSETWRASAARCSNGPNEEQLLAQCEAALREVESRYSDEQTRVLRQLKVTVHKVYPDDSRA